MKTILVTGGAGYIGSHTALTLLQNNYTVIVLDKKTTCPTTLTNHKNCHFFSGDIADTTLLTKILGTYPIDAVMHFAAYIEVGQSVKDPELYWHNNVTKTIALLSLCKKFAIQKIIFSSSCAVYGIPQQQTLQENHPKNPISPYGNTKYTIEKVLEDYAHAYNMCTVALRYFNAAGAWPEHGLGEKHDPETHIIPLALNAAYNKTQFSIFGTDYGTPDGTCIRDYLHVKDLASAHQAAYEQIKEPGFYAYNLGTSNGYSVKEIISTIEKVTENTINLRTTERRPGDPARLIAQAEKAQKELLWQPKHSSIENIISDAHMYHSKKLLKRKNLAPAEQKQV